MLLAIDIGNSLTHIGMFYKDELLGTDRFSSSSANPAESLNHTLDSLLFRIHSNRTAIHSCGICSVVPRLTDILAQWMNTNLKRSPLIVTGMLPLGIQIQYDEPESLGADRICTAIAAFKKYGGPAIVIDFGTATTYDVISEHGDFMGGVIAPGIKTAGDALTRGTAQLPSVELAFPQEVIGNSTISCIQSGILYGGLDAAEGMIKRLKQITGSRTVVIATGGLGKLMASNSKQINHYDEHLLLEGVKLIFERCGKEAVR
jgi:type III pantothenate kinase